MRNLVIVSYILLIIFIFVDLPAQEMPLVYEVENTGADCPEPPLLLFNQLPIIEELTDPFAWSDGRGRMSSFSDWRCRRAEIGTEIEYYEIGEKPLRPDTISASYANDILTVNITVNGNTLTLTSQVTLPPGDGPFPAVIGMGGGTGSLPSDIFTSRDIAQVPFSFWQVMAHTQTRGSEPINQLYPDLTYMGAYSAWSWGVSRLIDGLELVSEDLPIDLKRLAVTGCSFAGKMALFAGAFDERIALTIAQESGGGGTANWRFSETLSGVETLSATSHAWFIEDMFQFSNAVSKLPHDHHELLAMIAPRALFVLGNPPWVWLAEESGYVSCKAAHEVWKALGVPDRLGYSFVGDHDHCALPDVQKPEVEAFVEKFLLGNDSVNTDITVHPYSTNLSPWITWTTPILSDEPSYFEQASLIYPSDLQINLESNVTFRWTEVEDAEKYFIQLSQSPTFVNLVKSDSTISDTLTTITDLLEGKRYYWRVQVKNTDGVVGPWSNVWSFYTFIAVPTIPQLVSADLIQNRANYIKLIWNKTEGAEQYTAQISVDQSFATILMADSVNADTLLRFRGLEEGQKYYWRIRAKNVAGYSPWSDVSNFTILRAPTDLVLEVSGSNEITLNWRDLSSVEDGYVIERKQNQDTSFTILDTLAGSGDTYVDKTVEQGQTYIYRVKAYKNDAASLYSNEASLSLVGITEEKKIPTEYSLSQNYPNPFNPITMINYQLPITSNVELNIYNLLGKKLATLVSERVEAGYHQVTWEASGFSSGVYFYRIQSGDFIQTKKMVLMR